MMITQGYGPRSPRVVEQVKLVGEIEIEQAIEDTQIVVMVEDIRVDFVVEQPIIAITVPEES